MSEFALSIRPITPAEIPSEDEIIAAAQSVLESTPDWNQGKAFYKNTVQTYNRPKLPNRKSSHEAGWYCRVSNHTPEEATFDQFWSKLGENKAENEQKYIPEIKKVTLIKQISPNMSIWSLYYNFGLVISPRVFTVLQVKRLSEEGSRKAIIASIPIDLSTPGDEELLKLEGKGVRARYASVEQIAELSDGSVEWRMATTSTPGGGIPQMLAESTMAGKISEDVPKFLKWLRTTA